MVFVLRDRIGVAQSQTDVVPAVQQPLAGELVEREGAGETGGGRFDRPPGHIDGFGYGFLINAEDYDGGRSAPIVVFAQRAGAEMRS